MQRHAPLNRSRADAAMAVSATGVSVMRADAMTATTATTATTSRASVDKAVVSTFQKLCSLLCGPSRSQTSGAKKFSSYIKSFTGEFILTAFDKMQQADPAFEQACDDGDFDVLIDRTDWSHLFANESRRAFFTTKLEALEGGPLAEAKQMLGHVNSFVRVRENIPEGMLSEIESFTTTLMSDLKSKKRNFEDLRLEKIGEEVLAKCNESDINKLGDNMASLLPILQKSGVLGKMNHS